MKVAGVTHLHNISSSSNDICNLTTTTIYICKVRAGIFTYLAAEGCIAPKGPWLRSSHLRLHLRLRLRGNKLLLSYEVTKLVTSVEMYIPDQNY